LKEDSSPEGVAKVARGVIDRHEIELAGHFAIEEEVLFPGCGNLPILAELIAEHRAMEGMIEGLRSTPSVGKMERDFTMLTTHIRREERELFEAIQKTLGRDVLDAAGAEIERRVVRVCL